MNLRSRIHDQILPMDKSNQFNPVMESVEADLLVLGDWEARRSTGELRGPKGVERLEPRVMDLLFLLGERPGVVLTREDILGRLWPGVVVTEDALARAVFKLRKALGDDAKAPRFIETVPKRGYRLVMSPTDPPPPPGPTPPGAPWRWILGLMVLTGALVVLTGRQRRQPPEATVITERAHDAYFQYTHTDNETALELYQRVLRQVPDHGAAHAGMANALVQRVVRWPPGVPHGTFTRLGDALKAGITRTPWARETLALADLHARQAVALTPRHAEAHKALGFVRSAMGDFPRALAAYREALALDPDAWGPHINIGELEELSGHPAEGLAALEAGFEAMGRRYAQEAVRMRPWYAPMGLLIGDRHRDAGRLDVAERYYRKSLDLEPLNPEAMARLAGLLERMDRRPEATALRERLRHRPE